MIKVKINEVMGIYSAMHGMRNPLNSWEKNDTTFRVKFILDDSEEFSTFENDTIKMETVVGKNDKALARKLIDAGPSHRKFMRQIFVSMDIKALYIGGKNSIPIRLEQSQILALRCISLQIKNLRSTISLTIRCFLA